MIRVDTRVDGLVYTAQLSDDGRLVVQCGAEKLDAGRWNGCHIVGVSGAALLPHQVFAAFEAVFRSGLVR